MTALRTLIEDDMLAALTPLLKSEGEYLGTLKAYHGEITGIGGDKSLDEIRNLIGAMPAALIMTGGARFSNASMAADSAVVEMDCTVLCVTDNLRSRSKRARGDGTDPGMWQMLEDLRERLQGYEVANGFARMVLQSEDEVLTLPDYSIWQIEFGLSGRVCAAEEESDDLEGIDSDIDDADDATDNPRVELSNEVIP